MTRPFVSYRKHHIKNKIQGTRPKKSVFKKLWFWLLFLIVVIIFAGFYLVLFYPGLQIKNIIILGNNKIKKQELESIILSQVNKSIILFDENKTKKEILKKFPIIEKLKIEKKYPQTITLGVTERKPVGIYCDRAENCFLIDETGNAFESADFNADYFIVRQATNTKDMFVGENVISQKIISAIMQISKDLKDNLKIDLKEALVTSPVRLNVKTNENWQIYFGLDENSDIAFQLTKLNTLLNGQISTESRKNLRYINLMPKDRAIICDNSVCGE